MSRSLLSSRRQRGRGILALFAIAAVILCAPAPTAQAAGGLSIGPFLQEVTLAPGQAESSFRITVTNSTATELPLRLKVVDFGAADETGAVDFLPDADAFEHRYGLASWMTLEKDALVLAAGASQQVTVTINNQESLSPGGHYGAVVFQVDTEQRTGDIQPKVAFTKAVSTLVLAKKLGGERLSATLSGSTWSGPPFALPRVVKLRFLNTGNVHAIPAGDVVVTDTFGHVLSKGMVNPESTVILPESIRTYQTKLTNEDTLWLPGWVTVTTRYRVSESDKYLVSSTSFFIATPRSVVVSVVLLLVIAAVIRYRRHATKPVRKLVSHGHARVKRAAKSAATAHTHRKARRHTKRKP